MSCLYPQWTFLHVIVSSSDTHFYLQGQATNSSCPICHRSSARIHSFYWRTLRDTPIGNEPVILHLRARKFFCDHPTCSQRIFTERHPSSCSPYARKTDRLLSFLTMLGFSLSAEAASRFVPFYGVRVSADTFLSLVRNESFPSVHPSVAIGLDDWAFKKGHRYGTIICDLVTKRPIGLLNGRSKEEVEAWLTSYKDIRIVKRDGSKEYAKAITGAHPKATKNPFLLSKIF